MPRFLFFRHAQSMNNVLHKQLKKDLCTEQSIRPLEARARVPDPELSPIGRQQAVSLANHMLQFCAGKTLLVSSPFQRALDTMAPSLEVVRQRSDISVLCHGQIYEIGGCFHMKKAHPGLGKRDIASYCTEMIDIDDEGWFARRESRENYEELQERIERVYEWCVHLRDEEKYDTIILITHGAFQARLIRRIGHMSEEAWICHANTGYTSLLWDKQKGLLVEGINKTEHIPAELRTGDSVWDGWWPAVSHRGNSVLAVLHVPSQHPYLYQEIQKIYGEGTADEESIFFCAFQRDTLCGFVRYHAELGCTEYQEIHPHSELRENIKALVQETIGA